MRTLELGNRRLEEEAQELRENIRRYEHLEETIRNERKNIELKFQGELVELRNELGQERERNRQMEEECEGKETQVEQLSEKCKQLQKELAKTHAQLETKSGQYAELV